MRRYLQALAQSHMYLFDVLVRLASGPFLVRRDALLESVPWLLLSSLPLGFSLDSATTFGSKMPIVVNT